MVDQTAPSTDLCPMCQGIGEHDLKPPANTYYLYYESSKRATMPRQVGGSIKTYAPAFMLRYDEPITTDKKITEIINWWYSIGYKISQAMPLSTTYTYESDPKMEFMCMFEWRWM